jgi:hypothetical protein
MVHRLFVVLSLAVGVGCDTQPGVEPAPDAGVGLDGTVSDASVIDSALPDAAPDMPAPTCLDANITIDVDPQGPDTQIHPAVAAAGDGVWVAYNRVTPDARTFDVWATRLGCDGQPIVAPFEVSTDPVNSDTDPGVAVGADGQVFIVWTNDVQGADPNLVARYRVYAADGTPLTEVRPLITQRDGADFPGGQWMMQVAATADGFVVAGARGVEERSAFQVFGQRFDALGEPVGDTAAVERDMTQQLDPDVAVAADGTVWIGWGEGDQGNGAVIAAPWTDDPALMPRPVLPAPAGSTRVATAGDRAFVLGHLAKRGGTDIAVREMDGDGSFEVGGMGAIDIQPAMAVQGDVGMLAWFRRIQGNRAAVWTQRLDLSAGVTGVGEPVQIETDAPAAPYPMALTALSDGRFAIVWTEGESPAFRARLRFLEP